MLTIFTCSILLVTIIRDVRHLAFDKLFEKECISHKSSCYSGQLNNRRVQCETIIFLL